MITINPKVSPKKPLSKLKSDEAAEIRSNIKELVMEFHVYTKQELAYALELCEYNLKLTQAYLRRTSKSKVKATIVDFLSGKIEPGVEALGFKPDKSLLKEEVKEEEVKEVEVFVPTGPNFFETKVTREIVHYVLDFLDPISLGKAGFTCKAFYKISLHPLIYKKFCKKLYPHPPPLPQNTPFNSMLQRINSAPRGEFHPRMITQANKDIRSFVWIPETKAFHTPTSYFKQYKDMREVFLGAARLRFGGVYLMKEKYIRSGTKDMTGFYDPYHTVEFYRYFKFFPDGFAMASLSVNKLKKEKLAKIFARDAPTFDEEIHMYHQNSLIKSVLQGEFIVQKNKVHLRLGAKTTIYEFELEIESSAPGLFDQLKMVSQNMRLVENEHSQPLQNNYMGSKVFKFVKVESMLQELSPDIASVAS